MTGWRHKVAHKKVAHEPVAWSWCSYHIMTSILSNFAKMSFVDRRKHFRTPFDVITIYTKQSTPLPVDNSEMDVIDLSLKWRQPCACSIIDHGSQPMII